MSLAALALGLTVAAAAPEPFPVPPRPDPPAPNRDAPPEPPPGVDFGSDFAVGYLAGGLLAPWPDPGVHGFAFARYDAYLVARDQPGYRIGLSLWGGTTLGLQQTAADRSADGSVGDTAALSFRQFGAMTVLRPDPEAPVGPILGIGLTRLDIAGGYYGGPLALPLLTFEGGARQKLGPTFFLDWTVRASWGTARSGADPTALEEWWLIQGGLQAGVRVR
jgi:hypothetical protein